MACVSTPPPNLPKSASVDTDTIRATIDRALAHRDAPLKLNELTELDHLLRSHANMLLPHAQSMVGQMWRGHVEWWDASRRVDNIRDRLRAAPDGGLATHVQVIQLARDCVWLLEQASKTKDDEGEL